MNPHDLPIRPHSLAEPHRPQLFEHLCRLTGEHRYTRFMCTMSDKAIANFVERIDFARERLVAMPDLNGGFASVVQAVPQSPACWELAFTTTPDFQRRGIATLLGHRVIKPLVAEGASEAFIYCATENLAMRMVATRLEFTLRLQGGEILAHRKF